MTQLISARKNKITPEMEAIAIKEEIKLEELVKKIAEGKIVILKKIRHENVIPTGVGEGLSVKINANIGTSSQRSSTDEEICKLKMVEKCGADAVMDLSTGENIDTTRKEIISRVRIPIGTVPIYQAGVEAINYKDSIMELTKDKIFSAIEKHCADGVDFITVHCGVTKEVVKILQEQPE